MGPFFFTVALKMELHGEHSERLVGRHGPWESCLSAIANPEGSTSRVSRRPARQNGTNATGTAKSYRTERKQKQVARLEMGDLPKTSRKGFSGAAVPCSQGN